MILLMNQSCRDHDRGWFHGFAMPVRWQDKAGTRKGNAKVLDKQLPRPCHVPVNRVLPAALYRFNSRQSARFQPAKQRRSTNEFSIITPGMRHLVPRAMAGASERQQPVRVSPLFPCLARPCPEDCNRCSSGALHLTRHQTPGFPMPLKMS